MAPFVAMALKLNEVRKVVEQHILSSSKQNNLEQHILSSSKHHNLEQHILSSSKHNNLTNRTLSTRGTPTRATEGVFGYCTLTTAISA